MRACTLALLCVGVAGAAEPIVSVVPVTKLPKRDIADQILISGRVEPSASVEIRARVSGYLQQIAFKEGEAVKAGDFLFSIDARHLEAEADKARALLAVQEAKLRAAEISLDRLKRLGQAVAQQELDQATATVELGRAELRVAQITAELAKLKLAGSRITAPIGGRIARATVPVGSLVKADETVLATVVSEDRPSVVVDVPEATALRLDRALGKAPPAGKKPLTISVGSPREVDFPLTATILAVGPTVDRATATVPIRLALGEVKQPLRPGQTVLVKFDLGDMYPLLMVERQYVGGERGGPAKVCVLDSENRMQVREVVVESGIGTFVGIKSGYQEGDQQCLVRPDFATKVGVKMEAKIVEAPKPPER